MGIRLFLEMFLSVSVGTYGLEASVVTCLGYIGGKEEIKGVYHCIVPQVLRQSACSFHFSEFCLSCYIQGILVQEGGARRKLLDLGRNISPSIFFLRKKNQQSTQHPQKLIFLTSKGISEQ